MAARPSIGGQAVIEGVMMRGTASWAVAVRKPDSEIACETHLLPGHPERHRYLRWPLIRGVYVLVESMAIGIRALTISAGYAVEALEEEEPKPTQKQLGWVMAVPLILFLGFFIAAPAFAVKLGARLLDVESELLQNLAEGALRIGLFLGYILIISLIPDVRRVFQYHGAEHKTIYAYENSDPLEPGVVDRYSTLHYRCGTNFLFIVMFLAMLGHLVMDLLLPPSIPLRVSARILAIPLLAALSYEVIRAASRKENSLPFRIVSIPGIAMQKITTRAPSLDQIEVAIEAMRAVMAEETPTAPEEAHARVRGEQQATDASDVRAP